jgi:sugar phosphate isomerase/epimerase
MDISIGMEGFAALLKRGEMKLEDFLTLAGHNGIGADGVDLYDGPWLETRQDMARLGELLNENELLVASYGVDAFFVSRDKALIAAEMDKVRAALARAKEAGADKLRVHGGPSCPGVSHAEGIEMTAEALVRLAEDAHKHGIILALENGPEFPATAADVMWIIGKIGSSYLRPLMDTGGFIAVGEDPVRAANELASTAVHVHMTDAETAGGEATPCPLGKGRLQIKQMVRTLDLFHYKGFVSTHTPVGSTEPKKMVEAGVKCLRKVLHKQWR